MADAEGQTPLFEVHVREPATGNVRVVASGEVDLAAVPQLSAALEAAEAGDALRIVLDLSGITFIDSAGIGLLMRIAARAEHDGGRLRIVSSAAVDRVVDLCGVRGKLPFE